MKKIIALFAVVLLLSCSKDDGDSTLPVTYQNLIGKWNYKSIIRTNGTIVPYNRICTTTANWMEILPNTRITTYNYHPNCVDVYNYGCNYFTIYSETNTLYTPDDGIFKESTVKNLTATVFTLEFKETEDLNYYGQNVTDAKAYIFERQQN